MKQRIRKIVTLKNNGNITSMIIGQMFILLIIILCLFNFKMYILNTLFNNIDDSLTSSLLAGAIVNVEEYGKSNQLIIHNGDAYNIDKTWSDVESAILLSELEYGSDIQLDKSVLDKKKTINIDSRSEYTLAKRYDNGTADDTKGWDADEKLIKSIEAIVNTLKYNISNGAKNSSDTISNITNDTTSKMTLGRDIVDNFIASGYIVDNIEVTRLDIYNVYKADLAERHVYQSEYMIYDGSSKPNKEAKNISWSGPSSTSEFDSKYLPCEWEVKSGWEPGGANRDYNTPIPLPDEAYEKDEVTHDLKENENYAREMENYERKRAKWQKDYDYYSSGQLVCYTNTHTTYQGNYDSGRVPYKYFYATKEKKFNINTLHGDNALKISGTERAPIVGYGVFSYKNKYSGKYNKDYDTTAVIYNTTNDTSYKYTDVLKNKSSGVYSIPLDSSKMPGAEIENTSLYVELTFTVTTFPRMQNESPDATDLNTIPGEEKTVTVARLIDIELNTDN